MNTNDESPLRLPPHDFAAEQGVLGCCLMDAANIQPCLERFVVDAGSTREVFYDLRHQLIFEVLCFLKQQNKAVDLITVVDEVRKRQALEQVGGVAYLAALENATPTSHNLESYLGIVWEKYIARRYIADSTRAQQLILQQNGITEGNIAGVENAMREWKQLATRSSGITPTDLKKPVDFGDGVFDLWFQKNKEEEGWEIPFSFPFRVRRYEMTLLAGEDGSGKSIFTGHLAVHLIKQGLKGMVASFEEKTTKTLHRMTRQTLGQGPFLPETVENQKKIAKAMAFLNGGMWIYDFVGITDWRYLLDVMRYAREKEGVDFFVVDSVMRIGIPEDDLASQSLAAAQFAGFTVNTGAHVFVLHHFNKSSDGGAKAKITGSKRWSDNANNVIGIARNMDKARRLAMVKADLDAGNMSLETYNKEVSEQIPEFDTNFILEKQRYAGTIQNGAKKLWFDFSGSQQFRDRYTDRPFDYLQ
jgi:replicative DNA helicase